MMDDYEHINAFWFGRVEQTIVPTERRAKIWFGEDPETDAAINELFSDTLQGAIRGQCDHWQSLPRGQLAAVILLDQFSRHIYRDHPLAYAQDGKALSICLCGIQTEADHQLSLIERVFYYFPLLHAEQLGYQEQSIHYYERLAEMAFSETRVIYDSFVKFAKHHYNIIERFGRFPQRNRVLGRVSTESEQVYLDELSRQA